MTCIAGLKYMGCVWIGGDSAATSSYGNKTIMKGKKIFKRDSFLIGLSGSIHSLNLLRYTMPFPDYEEMDLEEYLVTKFIPQMQKTFEENGQDIKGDSGERYQGNTILIASNDRLFKIGQDFQVLETQGDYMACGSGEEYALGAMHVCKDMLELGIITPQEMIFKALEAATQHCATVASPYTILNSKETN